MAQRTIVATRTKAIKAIDLFCGAGGSSWGACAAGVEVVAAFDMWAVAEAVYRDNFPGVKFYSGCIEDRDIGQVVKEVGHVDLIMASPECTNHSVAKGNKPRCEKSRETALQVVRFAKAFKPRWVVVENVVSMQNWSKYAGLIKDMGDLGYHSLAQKLNAADFGVPQARRRLFLLFDLKRKPDEIKPPERKRRTAAHVVNLNGKYHYTALRTERRAKPTLARADRAIANVGEKTAFLVVYYGSDQAGGWQSLDVPLRTITTLDRFALVKPGDTGHVMRMLQPEELKAAMGWPKGFKIQHGTRRDKVKMIGNAVCPEVMKEIALRLSNDQRSL
ncbi:MAG: DNA cytosine methyltransferase [Phycisphaerales bacterium]